MRVPEGWKLVPINATRKMIDAAETVNEDGYDAMHKAMLANAPAPPAQEDEPVAEITTTNSFGYEVYQAELLEAGVHLPKGTKLYARPAPPDKLREAAKEVVSAIIALEGTEIEYRLALNLATANKKLVEALKDQK